MLTSVVTVVSVENIDAFKPGDRLRISNSVTDPLLFSFLPVTVPRQEEIRLVLPSGSIITHWDYHVARFISPDNDKEFVVISEFDTLKVFFEPIVNDKAINQMWDKL